MASEDNVIEQLLNLQKQLGKKQMFEEAVSTIKSLLHEHYVSASPPLKKLFYSAVCRVATILKTRYTSPGFWFAGLRLFEEAESMVSESSEREQLKGYVASAKDQLGEVENQTQAAESANDTRNRGYLFEGHLTVDPEPPQPHWLVQQQNLYSALANLSSGESSEGQPNNNAASQQIIIQHLFERLAEVLPEVAARPPRAPPASKEVVENLPTMTVTEEVLTKRGDDAECCICKESLVVGDNMQELPCKHIFHPPCLKPWLDQHNSCPICRHELRTDDHAYESWKEREKEAEEERKGAANAVRGGEFIII
ncbi:Zinc finger, RING-type [Dillenia turbinata]|uniref:RING-type E3 ubiquitin transferase n=1 Tax=Dillenia turbinata TaxID=194707 RepID=A0AAN8VA83_9MAGN